MHERDIAHAIVQHGRSHPCHETLPTNQCVYRVEDVTVFLKAGVALNKQILEEHTYQLTNRCHMLIIVPRYTQDASTCVFTHPNLSALIITRMHCSSSVPMFTDCIYH